MFECIEQNKQELEQRIELTLNSVLFQGMIRKPADIQNTIMIKQWLILDLNITMYNDGVERANLTLYSTSLDSFAT
jgi:hypothetical protein